MAWVDRIVPSDQDEQFENWRKEFQQERLVRIVREREIMKETAKRCKSYKTREQEASEALERKRQAILAQRRAEKVEATMRFQRNLPGFTVMDPEKFNRAIETITGRPLSNRSTPRKPTNIQTRQQQKQRHSAHNTFRRSISMEELSTHQYVPTSERHYERRDIIFARTNSITQINQTQPPVQYTSPLQEVQRRVIDDFAAQIQSTFQQPPNDETNQWEQESVDSLEASNQYSSQKNYVKTKVTGPIVRQNPPLTIITKQSQLSNNNQSSNAETKPFLQTQEQMRRSYHESFFVKNTPVTGNEQVTAWLGVDNPCVDTKKQLNILEKAPSVDGNESETNSRRKSILKRSPSLDSKSNDPKTKFPTKIPTTQTKVAANRNRVKDSLEVMNTKLCKDLENQKKTVRFAQDTSSERCMSDTRLRETVANEPMVEQPLRRVQSATMIAPIKNPITRTTAAAK